MTEKLLTRAEASEFLTARGYTTRPTTLAKLASLGGGPAFSRFGRRPLYSTDDLLEWAHARTTRRVASTAELSG